MCTRKSLIFLITMVVDVNFAWAVQDKAVTKPVYDVIIRGGMIYDGSGDTPYKGEVAITGDQIAFVGVQAKGSGKVQIDATGMAVSPGFINMYSAPFAQPFLTPEGKGSESDLRQGVTLEVMTERSIGPLNAAMRKMVLAQQKYPHDIPWSTLGEALDYLARQGVAPNIATFVSASEVRIHELGEKDVAPTYGQLQAMRGLVRQSMEEGALGLAASLGYAPGNYAETSELIALSREAARCGGIYTSHMRSESNRLLEAIDETLKIAEDADIPVEILHLKAAGKSNWSKIDQVISKVEGARARGLKVTANMYPYSAGATALAASIPPWAFDGGFESLLKRLQDPATLKKIHQDMQASDSAWENFMQLAGAEGTVIFAVSKERHNSLIGKTIAEIAREKDVSPQQAVTDLVLADQSHVGAMYFMASRDNLSRQIQLPWVSFGSDAPGLSRAGKDLKPEIHPRAYGTFAKLLSKYVRGEEIISLQEAVRRLTALPAENLNLKQRGALKPNFFADIVIFDPAVIQDHATYLAPHQYATGVRQVFVNGVLALNDGEPTGAMPGRVVRGRAWTGWPDGGCKVSARDWVW